MTGFSNEEKKEFPANYAVATASLVKIDPLKNAMNPLSPFDNGWQNEATSRRPSEKGATP
jgi:hypothetical protein